MSALTDHNAVRRRHTTLEWERARLIEASHALDIARGEGGDLDRAQQKVWFHTNQIRRLEHQLGLTPAPSTTEGAELVSRGRHAA
jgi:hypothetical protein